MEPIETYDPIIVQQYLNGAASEAGIMIKLIVQVFVVLVAGIVLWRISTIFQRKRERKRRQVFSDSRFQRHWKK